MPARGCGDSRVEGGIYLCCGLAPGGIPFEDVLVDYPLKVDATAMGLSSLGVTPVRRGDSVHVMDVVGKVHYPNVTDFIEEARRLGVSRRIPKTFQFDLLTRDTRLLLAHEKAYIDNHAWFRGAVPEVEHASMCPTHDEDHAVEGPCLGLCYYAVDGLNEQGKREVASCIYSAAKVLEDPKWSLAIFMNVPVHLEVVYAADGSHEDALEKAGKAGVPVVLEEE
jgi:hypothetical protein